MGVAPSRTAEDRRPTGTSSASAPAEHKSAPAEPKSALTEHKSAPAPPHMVQEIVQREKSIVGLEEKPAHELEKEAGKGIFLANNTKIYWVDKNNNNCFMLFPRGMSITWGDDTRYWAWSSVPLDEKEHLKERSDTKIDVAELLDVCWLEIHGKLKQSYLNPKTTYEVFFKVKLDEDAYGWSVPVDLRLTLSDGKIQQHKVNLDDLPKMDWRELKVGEVPAVEGQGERQSGDLEISMIRYGGQWKSGLVIKCIKITPMKDPIVN